MAEQGPKWLYCLPWWPVGKKHTAEWAKKTYGDGNLITLDQLPEWKVAK